MPVSTPDAADRAKLEWVERVLGVTVSAASGDGTGSGVMDAFARAKAGWDAATAKVERQVAILKRALLASDDPEFHEIAEDHLDDLFAGEPQRLDALLANIDARGQAGLRDAAAEVKAACASLRSVLDGTAVRACEDNPMRVPLTARATFSGAMARVLDVLDRAAAG